MDVDKLSAYQTLYTCLETVALLMAPISPFFADRLYTDLTSVTKGSTESVHLALFPEAGESDENLEARMKLAQEITSMVLSLRRKVNIKVRQPLSTLMIPVLDEAQKEMIESMADLILNEVNVKTIKYVGNDEGVLVKRVKPDFKKLGPKFGKAMKSVAASISSMSQADIAALERNGSMEFDIDGVKASVELADVEIISEDIPGWQVANDGNITVALDVTITDELRNEGIARDIVNRIQNIRKGRNYDIVDKIKLTFAPDPATEEAIKAYGDYIAKQVLATSLEVAQLADDAAAEVLDIDGTEVKYTDEELQEFKELILAKLEKAQRDYDLLKANVMNNDGNDTADTSPTFKVLEEGASTLGKEEAGQLAQRQMKFIQHLQAALVRIENKTYGICRATGKLIPKERLRAVPHATLSIDVKQQNSKK